MKLLFYVEKYQNAILGTLLIHVLIFVWLNIQNVSFYVIKPIEKTVTIIDYSNEEIKEIIENENGSKNKDPIEFTNVSSNFDQTKSLNETQKKLLEKDVLEDLKKFEADEFKMLDADNPSLTQATIESEKNNENEIFNKSAEKMSTATAKYFVKDRHMTYQKIPSYLCNSSGIVRIDIKVNQKGNIVDYKINYNNTNTKNECLIKNAINYTKQWRFNSNYNQNLRVPGWIEFVYLSQ
tara:strand:- start:2055 stop:2765 length:711 start_codon:yes stop_codon:yes gene_type:complete